MSAPPLRVAIDASSMTPHLTGVGRTIREVVAETARAGVVTPIVIGPESEHWRGITGVDRIFTRPLVGG